MLPRVFESADVPAETSGKDAQAAGLPGGIPLAAGAADQAAAALGMGVVSPGDISVTLGTSGVVYMQTDGVIHDPSGALHTFCHSLPGTFQLMGGVLSAAGSLAWVRSLAAGFIGGSAGPAELRRSHRSCRSVTPRLPGITVSALPYRRALAPQRSRCTRRMVRPYRPAPGMRSCTCGTRRGGIRP